jgi:hypothetical protein
VDFVFRVGNIVFLNDERLAKCKGFWYVEFDPYTTKWRLKYSAKYTIFGDQQNSKESRDMASVSS